MHRTIPTKNKNKNKKYVCMNATKIRDTQIRSAAFSEEDTTK